MKKLIALLLSSIMSLSLVAVFASCKDKSAGDENSNHQFTYTETDKWLVKGGQTDYKIVMPTNVSAELGYAKDELVRIVKEATGVTIPVVTDAGKTHTENAKYISLGETSLLRSSGITIDKEKLHRDGLRIITKDDTIYIAGGSDVAVLYGVYDFLKIHFNFETYSYDCYTLDKNVKEEKVLDFDVTDIPDIQYRQRRGTMNPSTQSIDDQMFAYRMRSLDSYGNLMLPIHTGHTINSPIKSDHNSLHYLPKEEYENKHPKFYSSDGSQLCYMARGDEAERDIMTTKCAEKIEESLRFYPAEEYPQYIAVQLGIMDMAPLCNCSACEDFAMEHEGAKSATIVRFMNEVGKKVNDWMALPENAAYARKDFQYMFFSYADASVPPFSIDKDGTIHIKDDVKPIEGVNVVPFCAMSGFDYGKPFDSETNQQPAEYFSAWGKVYKNSWAWSYGAFFNDYMMFYDNYSFYSDYYKFLKENNYIFTFPQIHDDQRGAYTGFFTLANYICSKLSWDVSLDVNDLIDAYFDAMYKDAADIMQEVFTEYRLWFGVQTAKQGWSSSSTSTTVSTAPKYWTYGFIHGMMDRFDRAYEAISVYEKDAELYTALKHHIDMEWLNPAYVAICNYRDNYTEADYNALKQNYKMLISELGVTRIREFVSIDSTLESL